MRRKKDNKRVLRAGNGRSTRKKRRGNNSQVFKPRNNRRPSSPRGNDKPKRSSKTVFIVIVALVAFIVGAGVGISMSFDDGSSDNETHIENVTVEMTTNLNNTTGVVFEDADHIDYNENQSLGMLNQPVQVDEEEGYSNY